MKPWQRKIQTVKDLMNGLETDLESGPHKDISDEAKLSVVLGMLSVEGTRDDD